MAGNQNSGRRATPSALKEARGNPGKRPLPHDEPKPDPVRNSKPPSFVTKEAAKHWPTIARQLENAKVLTVMDETALALYCQLFVRYIAARDVIDREGMTMITPTGFLVERPEMDICNKMHDRMLKILIEYGCTPASRTRVKVATGGEDKGNRFAKGATMGSDDDD